MKININNKLWILSLLIVSVENIFASTNALHTHTDINWWGIGDDYSSVPALGWYTLTFLIFLSLVIYYGYKILTKIFNDRSIQIQREIIEARQLKISAREKLKQYHQKMKGLNKQLETIFEDFRNKSKTERALADLNVSKIHQQINANIENMIKSNILQIKMDLKRDIINSIILEVLKKVQSNQINSTNVAYKKKILKNISSLKINI